jgi:hypothetical protein
MRSVPSNERSPGSSMSLKSLRYTIRKYRRHSKLHLFDPLLIEAVEKG